MISRPIRRLLPTVAVLAALAVLLTFSALTTYGLLHLAQVSTRVDANQRANTKALCAFRADLQSRVQSGVAFLRTHHHGIAGIPAATLQASIVNEQRTIATLASLICN